MKIQNVTALATTELRKAALHIAEAGLEAIDTPAVIRKNFVLQDGGNTLHVDGKNISLLGVHRVYVVGVGKCALRAVKSIEEILGDRIAGGVVIDIESGVLKHVKSIAGDHPFPTARNVEATDELVKLLKKAKEDDLVIAVVSGGGSTLLCYPVDKEGHEQESAILKELFKAGADIVEMNTIRKHLSKARGGFLAEYAYPARMIALIMSDVPGDRLEFVSSGPTIKDTTTLEDAKRILAKYAIEHRVGSLIVGLVETPKDDTYFRSVKNILIVSNKTALHAMDKAAAELGWKSVVRDAAFAGEARDLAKKIAHELHEARPHSVLLYGGESTVTIVHDGKGGRSQELALSATRYVKEGELILPFASDGRDNTDFAGGLCDILTVERASKLGLDVEKSLDENTSYDFFKKVGDQLLTGNTGSNVSDLIIAIKQ